MLVLRQFAQLLQLLVQILDGRSHEITLIRHQLEPTNEVQLQAILIKLWPTEQILPEQFEVFSTQLRRHMAAEAIPNFLHIVLQESQQRVRKAVLLGLLHGIQHWLHGMRHLVITLG